MPGDGDATRPWAATLLAIVPAFVAVVAVETLRVVGNVRGPLPERVLGTLAEVTSSGLRLLGPLVLAAAVGAVALAGAAYRRWRLPWWCALVLVSATQVFLIREEAIEAPHLARSFLVTASFVAVGAVHAALVLWLSIPDRARRTRRVGGGAIAVGSLAVAAAHYQFLTGLYPTLHTSLAMGSFLGIHVGLAMGLTGARLPAWVAGALVAVPALVLGASVLAPAQTQTRDRARVAAHSALVRPVMISETPEHLLRPDAPPQRLRKGAMRPDPDALARFAAHSGLPGLPEGFDLADHDVLLVFIDALRYDRTSLADPALDTTPTIRDLVAHGAYSFTRAYSPSNGTFPSMASVLSMTIPSFVRLEIHARHWHGRLRPEQVTAPEVLSKAGYRTFWVSHDFKRVMTLRVHGLEQGFDRYLLELIWPGRDLDADARIVTRAVQEIRAARAAGERYFGVVFLCSPHDDYQVHFPRMPSATDRDRYDQEVRYADLQVRRLLDEVARGSGLDRTVVVVTGDHGEAFGEHRHRFHLSSLYSEQVRVPLVIWLPRMGGEILDAPTSNLYVLPWLLLEGPEPSRAAARAVLREDLGPVLRETEGAVVSEFIARQYQEAALRYEDYTVYYDLLADYFKVYDARRDPAEQRDLREDRADLVERFTPVVQAYRSLRFDGQQYFFTLPDETADQAARPTPAAAGRILPVGVAP